MFYNSLYYTQHYCNIYEYIYIYIYIHTHYMDIALYTLRKSLPYLIYTTTV